MVKLHYTGSRHRCEVWQPSILSLLEFLPLQPKLMTQETKMNHLVEPFQGSRPIWSLAKLNDCLKQRWLVVNGTCQPDYLYPWRSPPSYLKGDKNGFLQWAFQEDSALRTETRVPGGPERVYVCQGWSGCFLPILLFVASQDAHFSSEVIAPLGGCL